MSEKELSPYEKELLKYHAKTEKEHCRICKQSVASEESSIAHNPKLFRNHDQTEYIHEYCIHRLVMDLYTQKTTKRFKLETLYDVYNENDYDHTDCIETKYGTLNDLAIDTSYLDAEFPIDTSYETDSNEEKRIVSKLKNFIENCNVKDSHTWIVNPIDEEQSKLTRIK